MADIDIGRAEAAREQVGSGFSQRVAVFLSLAAIATITPILAYPALASMSEQSQGAQGVVTLLLLMSTMHVALTFFFFTDKKYRTYMLRRPLYFFAFPAALIVTCGATTYFFQADGLSAVMVLYHAWLLVHYGRQNYGLLCFACAGTRAQRPQLLERIAFHFAPIGAVIAANPLLSEVQRVSWLAQYNTESLYLGAAIYGVAVIAAVIAAIRSMLLRQLVKAGAIVLLVAFWAPTFLVKSYTGAVMGYAIAHALQYWIFMYYLASDEKQGSVRGQVGALAIASIAGWCLIWATRERAMWGDVAPFIVGAELALIMWHFIVDGGLWRLSNQWQRTQVRERFDFIFGPR